MGILIMRVQLLVLVIFTLSQAKIAKRAPSGEMQIGDFVSQKVLDDLKQRIQENKEGNTKAEFKKGAEKRGGDPNFNIKDLVDLSSIELPASMAFEMDEEISNTDIPGEHLSPADFRSADSVEEAFDSFEADPIESAGLFEGDIQNVL